MLALLTHLTDRPMTLDLSQVYGQALSFICSKITSLR